MGHVVSRAFVFVAATFLGGCGSNHEGVAPSGVDSGRGDDGGEGEGAAGEDSSGYPAFSVDAPQIQKNDGIVLTSPVIVTVTWPGDTNAPMWEAFGDAIGASPYWAATTAPYGVGPATSGPSNHVRMTQPLPATLAFDDVENFVMAAVQAAQSDGGVAEGGSPDAGAPNPPWPLPTLDANANSQTIYSLFIPPSTRETDVTNGSSFCLQGGFGYHDVVVVGTTSVVFSVTLECPGQTLPSLQEGASHEAIEAATNPFETTGYKGFDADHAAWDIYTGYQDELADACEYWDDSYYQESGNFPYWVQRSWSNTSALAGHDPCVPAPAGPYHGMTLLPSQESTVRIDQSALGGPATNTKGFTATLGQPLTFQVGYFSDGSAAPWTIAYDFPAKLSTMGNSVSNGKATVAIDQTSGQNGDMANVTVTVTAKGALGFHVMAITWGSMSRDSLPHFLPLVIVDE
jgi:hypothetical protein